MALLRLEMNSNLFLKDPQDTDLGRKIIDESIKLIDDLGLEAFTFKKLSIAIESTEASIYRYFENKHKLLVYLIAWYWNWLEYRIEFMTNNVISAEEKIGIAVELVTEKNEYDNSFPTIDESALQRIVINESDKAYLTKQVDDDNKEGLFRGFKSLCKRIAAIVLEINPDYEYPHSLVSTVLQAAHQQIFFSEHLPSLSNHKFEKQQVFEQNRKFLLEMVLRSVKPKNGKQ